MDEQIYLEKQKGLLDEYEDRCVRCGECCGADGDPCANLAKEAEGGYYCKSYPDRLGPQKTVSGGSFNCVLIRDLVKFNLPYSRCPYIK